MKMLTDQELQDRAYRMMRALYAALPVRKTTRYSDEEAGRVAGESRGTMMRQRRTFEALGILGTETKYGRLDNGSAGRYVEWTLLVEQDEAYRRLDRHFAGGGKWAAPMEKVALRRDETEETVAIAGPEPEPPLAPLAPLRKDDARALVEAARQYRDRERSVRSKLDEIERMGVEVDRAKALRAIRLRRDERLEAVAAVLPYVEELEIAANRAERLAEERGDLRRQISALTEERNTLKEANKRLSEANVALRGSKVNGNGNGGHG